MKKNILILFLVILSTGLKLYPHHTKITHIHSASEYDYPPFCIVNEDSTAGGFSVELLKATCEAVGINADFKVGEWNVIKQELAEGKLDVLPMVARTPVREDIYDFTFPYLTYHGAVFVNKNGQSIKTLNELKDKTLMVLKSDISEEYVRGVNLSSKIITTSSFEKAFQALENGECDAVIAQKVMGLRLINQLKLENISRLNIKLDGFYQSFCFAVKEGNGELLAALNEGLSIVIADGTFETLQNKWFSPMDDSKQTRLVIGGDMDYPPYEYLNEQGEPAGYNIDLINAVAKKLGILVDIRLGVWSDIKNELLNGEIDAISGMYYTKERDKYLEFSPPHLVTEHVIVTRKNSDKMNSLSELRDKTILVMKGDVMHEYLLENGYDKEIKTVTSQEEALLVLSKGQYDCAMVAKIPSQYYIKKDKLENLRISEESFLPQEYCFAVKEGNEELLGHIYNAVTEIKATGEYRKIYSKWFRAYEETEVNIRKLAKYLAVILIPIILILILIISWNRTLKRKIDEKTKELKDRESLLFGVFDNMSSGAAVYQVVNKGESGSDYIIKFFNKKSLEIENKSMDQILGISLKDLRPEIDSYGLIPLLKKVWETGKPEFFPAKVYIDENYSNYYENNIFKLPSGDIVTIYNDVTEKETALSRIRESEEKYRQIFESASEGIFMAKPDGTILNANQEACKIFHRSKDEIISLGRDRLFDVNDPRLAESLDIRKKTGSFKGEVNAFRKDGSTVHLFLTSNIYTDSNGEPRAITIFSDISERKMAEAKLEDNLKELEKSKKATLNLLKDVKDENAQRKKAEENLRKLNEELENKVKERTKQLDDQNHELITAQESLVMLLSDVNESRRELERVNGLLISANKELEAFSYSVSHDLRSPLRAITGFADILKNDYCKDLDAEGSRYLDRINENSEKMKVLIDDLLEYSRVGRASINPVSLNLKNEAERIFSDLIIPEKGRVFNFSVSDNIPDIYADRTLFNLLLQNLLGNAVKFTSKKEIAEIKINYEITDKFHIITFEDNGAGFDEKYKSKLFEVFQRLHSTEDFAGTGVGLSIVYKIVAKHGWTIEGEGETNKGAKFKIKIPINKDAKNEK